MNRSNIIRLVIIGFGLLIITLITVAIWMAVSRQGKIGVTVEVLPKDATVTVDGQKQSPGIVYVTPGSHTFAAHKDGFDDDTVVITISQSISYVGLLPTPVSDAAKAWQTSGDIQTQREAIGSQIGSIKGEATRNQNTIINQLPYTDINGPFQIDYGLEPSRTDGVYIEIHYSSPTGRQAALKWIRDQGYKIGDLDIRYSDFTNPLTGGTN